MFFAAWKTMLIKNLIRLTITIRALIRNREIKRALQKNKASQREWMNSLDSRMVFISSPKVSKRLPPCREMREPRNLLGLINVHTAAAPSRLTLQTPSEVFISIEALDLVALSIPEHQIIWGAHCPYFSHVLQFSSAELIGGGKITN